MAQCMAETRIIGYLGRDPETKTVGSNTVVEFNVGVTRSKRQDGGDWLEYTTWFRCSAWNKTGERAAKLHKGSYVMVHGDLDIRTYTGRDKTEKTSVDISVNRVTDLTQREKTEKTEMDSRPNANPAKAAKATAPAAPAAPNDDDEGLPF